MDFNTAFVNVVGIEGGYSNHPDDNGGETMYGITIKVARMYAYNGPMRDLPLDLAKHIYKCEYWDKLNLDKVDFKLAEFLFDFAVNSGWPTAAKALQRAVGTLPDGVVGLKTLAAIGRHTPLHIMRLVFVTRCKLMAEHEDYEKFKNGWFARMFDITVRAVT